MKHEIGIKKILKLMLSCIFIFATINAFAEDPLPMAPKRYDNRDELPIASFISLSGADPLPPGEKPPATAVAKQKMTPTNARVPANSKKPVKKTTKTTVGAKKKSGSSRVPAKAPSKLPAKKTK